MFFIALFLVWCNKKVKEKIGRKPTLNARRSAMIVDDNYATIYRGMNIRQSVLSIKPKEVKKSKSAVSKKDRNLTGVKNLTN